MNELTVKRYIFKEYVTELYGYIPYCKHTLKDYKMVIYAYFESRTKANKIIKELENIYRG